MSLLANDDDAPTTPHDPQHLHKCPYRFDVPNTCSSNNTCYFFLNIFPTWKLAINEVMNKIALKISVIYLLLKMLLVARVFIRLKPRLVVLFKGRSLLSC